MERTIIRNILILGFFLFTLNSYGQNKNFKLNRTGLTTAEIDNECKEQSLLITIKEWLIPVSSSISLIVVVSGVVLSLREYRLKLKADSRLTESTAVEMDIKLMKGFTELLALAHSRKGSYLSEKTVEKMFDNKLFSEAELNNPLILNRKIEMVAVLNIYSGIAEQDAFIAAITNLGLKHEILRNPTIQALETMQSFKPELSKKYLEILKADKTEKNAH